MTVHNWRCNYYPFLRVIDGSQFLITTVRGSNDIDIVDVYFCNFISDSHSALGITISEYVRVVTESCNTGNFETLVIWKLNDAFVD